MMHLALPSVLSFSLVPIVALYHIISVVTVAVVVMIVFSLLRDDEKVYFDMSGEVNDNGNHVDGKCDGERNNGHLGCLRCCLNCCCRHYRSYHYNCSSGYEYEHVSSKENVHFYHFKQS